MILEAFHILYVDDDCDSRDVMTSWLEHCDGSYCVKSVESAREALRMVETTRFDLFIIDFSMPEVNGADLCYMLKQRFPLTPVLIYSAFARQADKISGLKAGADQFLIKPNDFDRFEPTVRRLLRQKSALATE